MKRHSERAMPSIEAEHSVVVYTLLAKSALIKSMPASARTFTNPARHSFLLGLKLHA